MQILSFFLDGYHMACRFCNFARHMTVTICFCESRKRLVIERIKQLRYWSQTRHDLRKVVALDQGPWHYG